MNASRSERDDAPLSIADEEHIQDRLPEGWRYKYVLEGDTEYATAVRESFPTLSRKSIVTSPQQGGTWRVGPPTGESGRIDGIETETAAVTVLVEAARLAEAEKIVRESPEYDDWEKESRWLWMLGVAHDQLAAKKGEAER
jgi:hypothetical protein